MPLSAPESRQSESRISRCVFHYQAMAHQRPRSFGRQNAGGEFVLCIHFGHRLTPRFDRACAMTAGRRYRHLKASGRSLTPIRQYLDRKAAPASGINTILLKSGRRNITKRAAIAVCMAGFSYHQYFSPGSMKSSLPKTHLPRE